MSAAFVPEAERENVYLVTVSLGSHEGREADRLGRRLSGSITEAAKYRCSIVIRWRTFSSPSPYQDRAVDARTDFR